MHRAKLGSWLVWAGLVAACGLPFDLSPVEGGDSDASGASSGDASGASSGAPGAGSSGAPDDSSSGGAVSTCAGLQVDGDCLTDENTAFVAENGHDGSGDGSRARPYRSLEKALQEARQNSLAHIAVCGAASVHGENPQEHAMRTLEIVRSVALHGGFSCEGGNWQHDGNTRSALLGAAVALQIQLGNVGNVVKLHSFSVQAADGGTSNVPQEFLPNGMSEGTSLGARVESGTLMLLNSVIAAGAGRGGKRGDDGNAANGGTGGTAGQECSADNAGRGGDGGASGGSVGASGEAGANVGFLAGGAGGLGGAGTECDNYTECNGGRGGRAAEVNAPNTPDALRAWLRAGNARRGGHGGGGGGGGGRGGSLLPGGGGGGGGCGGLSGGHSVAAFLDSAGRLQMDTDSLLRAGNGGNGGAGGKGGDGKCYAPAGGCGGGGAGGNGGHGGWSVALVAPEGAARDFSNPASEISDGDARLQVVGNAQNIASAGGTGGRAIQYGISIRRRGANGKPGVDGRAVKRISYPLDAAAAQ